ncbi:MAG: transglutaminase family protein [Polyangiales bacterium]
MNEGVLRLADAVEERFDALDLRVTMGGEPTFIPEEPEGDEWNQGALGPEKLGYARRLAARLLGELYPGAVVMQVFGKHYPDEPLPRWVVLMLQRDDGVPLWERPAALLLDDTPGSHGDAIARTTIDQIARALGIDAASIPCVEVGEADPICGWALPLDRREGHWVSDPWPFSAGEPIELTAGESPLGLRLPLGELPEDLVRRALTVEVKDGALHIFFPPLDYQAFVPLLGAVADVAASASLEELVLCGYQPWDAEGVTQLGLAADPGVLEINLPPKARWEEYDEVLHKITTAARAEGLVTTRLHLNGQVQGTGGGAHVLFGGPSVDDNPFFRRPDLLASIVRYWQHHPSLSYLFSGQYVGPGSQAPRADETQIDRLYELETACHGVDMLDEPPDRGFLDSLFRNLMTDSSGNTHRAELCLDKLWNHASPTGLQGLVELRAFETCGDVVLQSLEALLARAILAMVAKEPRKGPLRRWGLELHDRYMLPAALASDCRQVCADLAKAGLPFEPEWLAPLYEDRFPVVGRLAIEDDVLVVQQALDPWPLMAEVSQGGATSRVVDNSTDRIQLAVSSGAVLEAHQVAVNGVVVPWCEVDGTMVAAVRYKSADGWPALHPHIPVQAPLTIEVLDTGGRVTEAARYHHWNPNGPVYEGPPRDLAEARERQRERWTPRRDLVGKTRTPRAPVSTEDERITLDLRRQP